MKTTLFYLIAIIFWLVIFETIASIYIFYKGDPLIRSTSILEARRDIGWGHKKHLNETFYNSLVQTNENGFRNVKSFNSYDKNSSVVLTLGPSSAFGWGVNHEDTYSERFVEKLNQNSNKKFISFNASQVGFSSYQGLRLTEVILKNINPEIVILSYGVNDIDRYRFFFSSDREDDVEFGDEKDKTTVSLVNISNRSNFVKLVRSEIGKRITYFKCNKKTFVSKRRLSLEKTLSYFGKMINFYKEKNSHVIIINTPHVYDESSIGLSNIEELDAMYAAVLDKARLKECYEASVLFEKYRLLEMKFIPAWLDQLNEKLEALAEEKNISFVNARVILEEQEHFVDPIHPSREGHMLIANELLKLF